MKLREIKVFQIRWSSEDVTYSWDIVIILIITLIICNRWGVWVRPRCDQVLIAQLHFVVAGQVTVVLCTKRK